MGDHARRDSPSVPVRLRAAGDGHGPHRSSCDVLRVRFGGSGRQNPDIDERLLRRVFGVILIIHFSLAAFLALAAPLIATFFAEPRVVAVIRVLSLQFVLARSQSFRTPSCSGDWNSATVRYWTCPAQSLAASPRLEWRSRVRASGRSSQDRF